MVDRELLEAQKELVAHTFNQARAYTNVILVAGYVGFFAIWNFLREDLTKLQVFWSGFLISLSLTAFIAWEIYGMLSRSRSILGVVRAVNDPEHFKELLLAHQKNEHQRVINLGRIWIPVLAFTVVTAFSAVAIVLWAFVQMLWKSYRV